MTADEKIRMQYAGAMNLLCECHLRLPSNRGPEIEDLRESILTAVADFCASTGWIFEQCLHRIDLIPPDPPERT